MGCGTLLGVTGGPLAGQIRLRRILAEALHVTVPGSSASTRRAEERPRRYRFALDADAVTCHHVGAPADDLDDSSPAPAGVRRTVGDDRPCRPPARCRGSPILDEIGPPTSPGRHRGRPILASPRPGGPGPLHSDDCAFRARIYQPAPSVRGWRGDRSAEFLESRRPVPSSGCPADWGCECVAHPLIVSARRAAIWVAGHRPQVRRGAAGPPLRPRRAGVR